MMANTIARARPVRLAAGDRALSTRARRPGATSSHFYVACFLLAIALVLYPSDASAQECGPGEHWVDHCPAGTDEVDDSGAVVGIDTDLDCVADVSLVLYGPTEIVRLPHPQLTHAMTTEIVSLDLSGGGVRLRAGSDFDLPPSDGEIVEQDDDAFLADSYFKVFFEVDLGGSLFAYNQTALKVTAVIDRVPPPDEYIHPTGCLPLYNAPSGGIHVANLVSAMHSLFPEWPLAIELPSFSAAPKPGAIELIWKTEVELDSTGFNVLRSTTPDGRFQRVNRALIAAGGGPAFGAGYNFIDDTVAPHTSYYYLLEDVDTSGVRTLHGAGACTMNVDPECKPLAVTITPETERPKRNPHD